MKSLLFVLIIMLSISITNHATADDKPLTGQAKLDSLLAELPKAKGDTNEVKLLNNLSIAYQTSDARRGIQKAKVALQLARDLDWEIGLADSYISLGINLKVKGDFNKALSYYKKALKVYTENGDESGKAKALGDMGHVYTDLVDYPRALDFLQKALRIFNTLGNKKGEATTNMNIGNIYFHQSEYATALKYYYKSLKIQEKIGDKRGMAITLSNMGNISRNLGDFDKAIGYMKSGYDIFIELDDEYYAAVALGNIGNAYGDKKEYIKAIEYHNKAIAMNIKLGNKKMLALNYNNIAISNADQKNFGNALDYYNKSLDIALEIKDKYSEALCYGNIGVLYLIIVEDSVEITQNELNKYLSIRRDVNLNKSIEYLKEAIRIFEEIGEKNIRSGLMEDLSDAYKLKGDFKKWGYALKEHHKLKDSVFNQEKSKQLAALEKAREDDVNRIQIEKQQVQLTAQESEKMFIIYSGVGIVAFVVAILILIAYQRKKSDKLLYNVLPISIAKRLKKKEHPISDHFIQASIIFIDIVGFTAMSKDSDPTDIVQALNKIFTHYDSIASKHGLEKIKTIGDCYMAAAGIPVIQTDNTLRAARMALEVRDYMVDYYTDHGFKLDVRIGLDCGPVVAGVIGEKKFIYDMWSDAVNTASRMESTGQSGSVHISERFKEAVAEFDEFEFIDRGEMEIKGKGKMKTFFIEQRKVEVV